MRTILYITTDLLAASLPIRLKEEGNNVIVFEEADMKTLQGLVEKQPYSKIKDYVSKLDKEKDLIVFEDCDNGDRPLELRKLGYNVVGGTSQTDKMEKNRILGGKVAEMAGKEESLQRVDKCISMLS